jgi:hypothetical protein
VGVWEATSISAEAILAEHNEGCKEEWASTAVDRMGCVWGTSSSRWGTDVRAVVKRLTRTPASYSTHSRVILYNGSR